MKIVLPFVHTKVPVITYGGAQRVMWWLGKELVKKGHEVTFLVKSGSYSPFAEVIAFDDSSDLNSQIPDDTDIVHFFYPVFEPDIDFPYIVRIGGNGKEGQMFDRNTVFLSESHAKNHASEVFVYNGLDVDYYGKVNLDSPDGYIHFLAKASLKRKNIKGAKKIATQSKMPLQVIGGYGLPFNKYVIFRGFLGGERKLNILRNSSALLFPVIWEEPFGNAMIESLYYGCPVLGTPYGSLPELINEDVGYLSDNSDDLIKATQNIGEFNRTTCHEYVMEYFTADIMAENYLQIYERVLNGEVLNSRYPVNHGTSGYHEFS